MLIYGTRATTLDEFDVPLAECAHCGQRGTQRMAVFGRYAHVFWIPLFPIGKVAVAECMHCKRTLRKKEFSTELKRKYEEQSGRVGRPVWHWAGLTVLLLFFGSSAVASAFREVDPRKALLDADMEALTANPTVTIDPIAYQAKTYFDDYIVEEMHPERFRYHTRVSDGKVLLLMQIPNLKDLEKSARPELVTMINEVADEFPHLEGKERYIGVQGRSSMMLVQTPTATQNSSYADEEPLYMFYED